MLPTRGTLPSARSRHVGSGATGAREPSQVRKEAALSGSAWVPPGRLTCAASGPLCSCGFHVRCAIARATQENIRASGSPPVKSPVLEGCESGRIGTLGKRVWGNSPWVRIPLPPLGLVHWSPRPRHDGASASALSAARVWGIPSSAATFIMSNTLTALASSRPRPSA